MIRFVLILVSLGFYTGTQAQQIEKIVCPFEQDSNTTSTYEQTIAFYQKVADQSSQFELKTMGQTDIGKPLHYAVLSKDGDFDPVSIRQKGKQILLVNNAIHAGEPCGVDASMLLIKDYLGQSELQTYLESTVVVFIPIYNVGGALNRNSHTRANQNGPESYGFRGNAKNLDLNRDFIKCDSKNAQTFNQLFTLWQPDVFIDNHTSNGADYQYTLTLIATQHNRLDPNLAKYMNQKMLPRLYSDMEKRGWGMTPYVYVRNTPDDGITGFLDLARYASGYATLFNTLSFIPEAHMLKPFKDRVLSVYQFMDVMIRCMHTQRNELQEARKWALEHTTGKSTFDLNWTVDSSKVDTLLFKGYQAGYKTSVVTGKDRLYYNRAVTYEKNIPFYNHYKPIQSVQKPKAYIVPQAYSRVIERMQWNNIKMTRLSADQEMEVELYRIVDYKDRPAYEGHYLHYNTRVEKLSRRVTYRKGDYKITVDQPGNRYIVETLEPAAPDAFFAWNFFDGILMQKEYFSAYVFEDLAAQYVKEDADLKAAFERKKDTDAAFAQNSRAQLEFIYKHSKHYEPTHRIYPVGRLME